MCKLETWKLEMEYFKETDVKENDEIENYKIKKAL